MKHLILSVLCFAASSCLDTHLHHRSNVTYYIQSAETYGQINNAPIKENKAVDPVGAVESKANEQNPQK